MAFSRNAGFTSAIATNPADTAAGFLTPDRYNLPLVVTDAVSGGIPYFSSTTTEGTSALLAANSLVIGGGSGAAPFTSANLTFGPTAGQGLAIAAGTAASAVSAETISQTWNFNTSAIQGVDWTFTDISSHANTNAFRIRGGAAGATELLALSKAGSFSVAGKAALTWSGNNLGLGNGGTGVILPSAVHLSTANIVMSGTAPTIASGFGTSPSRGMYNGTAAIQINVGTGGTASSGVIGMPAAAQGWAAYVVNLTAVAANRADQRTVVTGSTTTSITVQNQTISTGAALAWTASDILQVIAMGF